MLDHLFSETLVLAQKLLGELRALLEKRVHEGVALHFQLDRVVRGLVKASFFRFCRR